MKTLFYSIFFLSILNGKAQHVYKEAMNLIIIDSTEKVVSPSDFSGNNYELYIQKGADSLYKENNIDSSGVIHISRNDIMPGDVGLPWNMILIHKTDTMFVQYQNRSNSNDSLVKINLLNGNYIYDLIRTTNTNLELEWKLIAMEKINDKGWVNHQITQKNKLIEQITQK